MYSTFHVASGGLEMRTGSRSFHRCLSSCFACSCMRRYDPTGGCVCRDGESVPPGATWALAVSCVHVQDRTRVAVNWHGRLKTGRSWFPAAGGPRYSSRLPRRTSSHLPADRASAGSLSDPNLANWPAKLFGFDRLPRGLCSRQQRVPVLLYCT